MTWIEKLWPRASVVYIVVDSAGTVRLANGSVVRASRWRRRIIGPVEHMYLYELFRTEGGAIVGRNTAIALARSGDCPFELHPADHPALYELVSTEPVRKSA